MKNLLIIFFILIYISLFGFIENINFEQNLDHCAGYISTLAVKEDKLYVDSIGSIECYNILENGELEFNDFLPKYYYLYPNSKIYGDSLYIVDGIPEETYFIKAIDISGNVMNETNSIAIEETPDTWIISKIELNKDYLVYHHSGQTNSIVIDRDTFDYVTEIETGGYFVISDTLLFLEMTDGVQSALSIIDISNIHNPVEIAFLITGIYEQFCSFLFSDDLLVIGRNYDFQIIDISNIEEPYVVSIIDNIPNVPVLPITNFFFSSFIKDDYLVFSNNHNSIWVYDISDIEEPELANYNEDNNGNNKDNLILNNESFYQTSYLNGIQQMDANNLPEINIIDQYGNLGFFGATCLCYPFFIYTDYIHNEPKSYYFDVRENNPQILTLCDFEQSYLCNNDTLLISISSYSSDVKINIFHYNEYDVTLMNRFSIQNTNLTKLQYFEPYIYTAERNTNLLRIYSINEDYTLELIHTDNLGLYSNFSKKNDYASNDYVFIEKKVNQNETVISVIENTPPFNEISSFSLLDFFNGGPGRQNFHLLSDNRALVVNKVGELYHDVYLCEYTFPDELEIIDEIVVKSGWVSLYDHYFIATRTYDGKFSYYNWLNDEIELAFNHDFDVGIYHIELLPELSKFYGLGAFTLNEYSCDFVNSTENEIPIPTFTLTNHPNPFNPETVISFELNTEITENTEIIIYNAKGQKVKTLECVNSVDVKTTKSFSHNSVTWNGRDENNKPVSSGVYLYQLKVNGKAVANRKCLLLK